LNLAATQDIIKSISDAKAGLLTGQSTVPSSQQYARYVHKAIDKAREYWYIVVAVLVLTTGLALKPLLNNPKKELGILSIYTQSSLNVTCFIHLK
jgi:hypothetical protein